MLRPTRLGAGLTGLGVFISFLLVLGLCALGAYVFLSEEQAAQKADGDQSKADVASHAAPTGSVIAELIEPASEPPRLEAAATYTSQNGIIDIDISEYAGYAGLIVANGGMEPNANSLYGKDGLQVRLKMSEGENWSALNNGKFAASATTVDVLPLMGRQFQVSVPVQIAFSRGANGVVVHQSIKRVNDLAGKILVTSQFNEADFFIRYLAGEAGLGVTILPDLSSKPPLDHIGLVFCEDSFVAGDVFLKELASSTPRLAGCVSWAPKTYEVIEQAKGKARMLISNKNLLVVADILVVNKGFAEAQPETVKKLVAGLLLANQQLRDNPLAHIPLIAKCFSWDEAQAKDELTRVHFSNLPENRAFFNGTIDSAGSFGSIYQSSVLSYGNLITNPVGAERFMSTSTLDALASDTRFAAQKIAIAPIKSGTASAIEGNPLLSKDIRFFFMPNSSELAANSKENQEYLATIKNYLQISPGSMILLRGHVENSKVADFRQQGGEALVRSMALKAMELSKERANSVRSALINVVKIDPSRIEIVGRGWEEPSGKDPDKNRRVEVQWFTLE
jgi:NitT/TauT family transport system substrate-binding protein